MSSTPIGDMTTHGFEPPIVTQFSVFLDNRVGKLRELTEVFRGHALELVAFTVIDSADHAVVRLVTSRAVLARRLLARNELPFSEIDVLVVEIGPGQHLSDLCTALVVAELSIQYAYPLWLRPHGNAAIVLHCDDYHVACQVLRRKLFTLLGENDLGDNATPSDPDEPWLV
jgi:hypothetical protein